MHIFIALKHEVILLKSSACSHVSILHTKESDIENDGGWSGLGTLFFAKAKKEFLAQIGSTQNNGENPEPQR